MESSTLFGLLGFFAGAGAIAAFFISTYMIHIKRKESPLFLYVGLVFLGIGLRLSKSIVYFLFFDIASIGLALGFLGLASIGPFMMAYLMGYGRTKFRQFAYIHLLVPVLGAVACYLLSPSMWDAIFYKTATLILAAYLVYCWWLLMKEQVSTGGIDKWNRIFLLGVSFVWSTFVFQHIADTMIFYAFGSLVCGMAIYWLFFQSLKQPGVMSKSVSMNIPDEKMECVRLAFEEKEFYKKQGITINEMAQELSLPPYLISKAVKELYDKSFPETVNYFRVNELKSELLKPSNAHLKIEALAYDVGFSTPSSFYYAFKKVTGQTPTAYQKDFMLKSA